MANKILGIDYSPNIVKAVELEQEDKVWQVLNWSLNYLSNKENILTKSARVAISGPELVYQLVELPPLPENEVGGAIHFKLESLLSFPVEGALIIYNKIPDLPFADKQLFFVTAAPKKYILDSINVLRKSGLSLNSIIPFPYALKNMAKAIESNVYALINLGKYSTLIVLVKKGEAVFAREIKEGEEELVQSLVGAIVTDSGRLEIDNKKAEELMSKYGIPIDTEKYSAETGLPGLEVLSMIRPILEKMETEISRTFDYYREKTEDQTEFKKIYFSGKASQIKNILEHFRAELGFEIEPLSVDLKARLPAGKAKKEKFSSVAPELTVALGAATYEKKAFDLLPQAYTDSLKSILKKFSNFWLAGLVFLIFLALIWGFFFIQNNKLNTQLALLKKDLQKQGVVIKEKPSSNEVFLKLIKELGIKGNTDYFVKVMGQLHRITPREIYFQKITYDRKTKQLGIKGVFLKSRGESLLSAFIESLKADAYFQALDLVYLRENNTYTVPIFEFEISCALNGEN